MNKKTRLNRLSTFIFVSIHIFIVIFFNGCVSVPVDCFSESITSSELRDHVEFLAQPALGGRKPKSSGSKLARNYLNKQFKAFNLVPWGQAESFNQSFLLGTNVIGVLPGSDPDLADEYVILSAHYDHVGKIKDGVCLGACDNASGVAALLEIAEQLSMSETRPRRSICFAAFDCEEMFTIGAFAFSCRDDFDSSKIAAVVNVDMLGRKGFDVLDDRLFLVGTGAYRPLRNQIQQSVRDSLQIIPIGTDVVGPRGDHIAFEAMGIPALFFTCSLYKDYHRPTDTADKLNYETLLKSTRIIRNAVEILANSDERFIPDLPDEPDIEELEAIVSILSDVLQDPNALGLKEDTNDILISEILKEPDTYEIKEDVNNSKISLILKDTSTVKQKERPFDLLMFCREMAGKYLAEKQSYTREKREVLGYWLSDAVLNYERNLSGTKQRVSPMKQWERKMIIVSMECREYFVEAALKAYQHLNEHKPGLFKKMPTFNYEHRELSDSHLVLTELEDGQSHLVYFVLQGGVRINVDTLSENLRRSFTNLQNKIKRLFRKKSTIVLNVNLFLSGDIYYYIGIPPVRLSTSSYWAEITGTREEIIDALLLYRKYRNRAEIENKILPYVTRLSEEKTYEQWLDWRIQQGGWKDANDWIDNCIKSSNSYVLFYALNSPNLSSDKKNAAICEVVKDSEKPAWLRWISLDFLRKSDKQVLLTLTDILEDETANESREKPLPENHPLKPLAEFCRPSDMNKSFPDKVVKTISIEQYEKLKSETSEVKKDKPEKKSDDSPKNLGDKALERLKKITGQDFAKDQAAWKNWIEKNVEK